MATISEMVVSFTVMVLLFLWKNNSSKLQGLVQNQKEVTSSLERLEKMKKVVSKETATRKS